MYWNKLVFCDHLMLKEKKQNLFGLFLCGVVWIMLNCACCISLSLYVSEFALGDVLSSHSLKICRSYKLHTLNQP